MVINDLLYHLNLKTNNFTKLIRGKNNENRGLYFMYDVNKTLLYIGWASELTERLRVHIKKQSNTRDFIENVVIIKLLYETSFDNFRKEYPECQDIEFFLIDKMKPIHNKQRSIKRAYYKIA